MLFFDLQLFLFVWLLLWLTTIGLTFLFARRHYQRSPNEPAATLTAIPPVGNVESASFFSDLAHELRTPLAILLTHLEVLRLPQISEDTRQQSVVLMQQEAKRMSRLVHDLLELGYLETAPTLEQRPVDLHELVNQVITQIAPLADERQVTLSVQADSGDLFTLGDADRLRQVFLSLLDNAVKYVRVGDQVTVIVRHDLTRRALLCQVQDTGPGIPAEHLPLLTRRFHRVASEEISGSGLGLAVAQEILRRHHSELEISSCTEGAETGTTVRFALKSLAALEDQI